MALVESTSLVVFAFTAGALTFFAPCAYPLLPGYISYYLGRSVDRSDVLEDDVAPAADGGAYPDDGWATRALAGKIATFVPETTAKRLARAAVVGTLVSAGFFIVYGALAGVVVALGARLLAGISVLELVVGVVLIGLGSAMAVGWKPTSPTIQLPERRRSSAGYLGFGVLYAAAAAGCTAPIFIAVALKALSVGVIPSFVAFGAYAAGMSVLMIGVTVAAALGRDAILTRLTRNMNRIHRVAGVLLIVAGLVQIYFFLFRFEGLRLLGLA